MCEWVSERDFIWADEKSAEQNINSGKEILEITMTTMNTILRRSIVMAKLGATL